MTGFGKRVLAYVGLPDRIIWKKEGTTMKKIFLLLLVVAIGVLVAKQLSHHHE